MNKKQGKPLKMRLFFFLVTHIDGNPLAPQAADWSGKVLTGRTEGGNDR